MTLYLYNYNIDDLLPIIKWYLPFTKQWVAAEVAQQSKDGVPPG